MSTRLPLSGALALLTLPAMVGAQIVPAAGAAQAAASAAPSFPGWNVEYQLPSGWQVVRSLGRLQVLGSNTSAGAIFIAPGLYRSVQEAQADLSQFYQSLQLQAYPVEAPANTTIGGMQGVTATYASQDQAGRVVQGRWIALLTPHGTGVNLLAMTTAEQMPALRAVAEQLAASIRAGAPQTDTQAVAALAGNWMLYSGNYSGGSRATGTTSNSHEEFVTFDGRGGFQYQSSSTVMVSTQGYTGDAGGASSLSDQGTYTVIGNTLVFQGSHGQLAVDYQLAGNQLTAAGKTYLRQ